MKNQRHIPFKFGFLNNAQDPDDLKDEEAIQCEGIDADKLALGSVESSSYISGSETVKTYDEVRINGTDISLTATPGLVQYEDSGGTDRSLSVNIVEGLIGAPSLSRNKNGAVAINGWLGFTGGASTYEEILDNSGDVDGGVSGMQVSMNYNYSYKGLDANVFNVYIDGAGNFTWAATGAATTVNAAGTSIANTTGMPITTGPSDWYALACNNLNLGFNEAIFIKFSSVPGASTAIFSLQINELPSYTYTYRYLLKYPLSSEGNSEIRTAMGALSTFKLRNVDEAGVRNASDSIYYSPGVAPTISGQVTVVEMYRKSDVEPDYFRINSDVHSGGTNVVDLVTTSSVSDLIIADENDEGETELNDALGLTDDNYEKIFTFENSLWRVPSTRKDIIAYSPPGEWWRLQRNNTFKVTGDVVDIVGVKDTGAVDAPLTKVVLTTDGIYHITGSGIEVDPYKMHKVIDDINIEPFTAVNANGTLMFMSKSTDGGYDTGPYGQKIYEYDLVKLVEVSARVKDSVTITNTGAIEYAELRGGDKYLIKKTAATRALIYHRDAQNWVETYDTIEASNIWVWISKWFNPINGRYVRSGSRSNSPSFAGARFIRLDYIGDISFDLYFQNSAGGTSSVDMGLPTHNSRAEFYCRLPNIKSSKWQIQLSGDNEGAAAAKLYGMWFVN